jgi:hypothetical protein
MKLDGEEEGDGDGSIEEGTARPPTGEAITCLLSKMEPTSATTSFSQY